MPEFDTSTLTEDSLKQLQSTTVSNIYNGLDSCLTLEIYNVLAEELADSPTEVQLTYADALRKQAPFMEMAMRGIRVSLETRDRVIDEFTAILARLQRNFDLICQESFGCTVNANSPAQVKTLFYGILGLKEIKSKNTKGLWVPSVDEEALLKLKLHFYAEPLVNYILAIREIRKKISFLRTEIDPDGRFRTSLNIAGTVTGRTASSESDFGTGSNLQNVDRTLREVFVPDPGMIFVNVDLEQADARNVGAIIWNMFYGSNEYTREQLGAFLDACESGDLHTTVTRMTWDHLEWTGDLAADKKLAQSPFGDGDSYRDKAKKLGHGTNYLGQPATMAVHTKTPSKIIADFQRRYFSAFPLIKEWHLRTEAILHETATITTLFGRRRIFFGRVDESKTLRDAIAFGPQSMTGHEMDMGILQLWESDFYAEAGTQLLIQVHDSILFQVPYENHEETIPRCLDLLRFTYELAGGREFSVPLEAKIGWNWGDVKTDKTGAVIGNPLGLTKFKGRDPRTPPAQIRRLRDLVR